MAVYGRPLLRDLFTGAPTPHIAHPPRTHHRDYFIATDGSFVKDGGGLGVIIESNSGERLLRIAQPDNAPDNNVAEYRALRLGLEKLGEYAPNTAAIGILLDHNDLAANVNATTLGMSHPDWPAGPISVPEASTTQWNRIKTQIGSFRDIRAACIHSDDNPAHVLANAPHEYPYLDGDSPDDGPPALSATNHWSIPPPSRANRHADD